MGGWVRMGMVHDHPIMRHASCKSKRGKSVTFGVDGTGGAATWVGFLGWGLLTVAKH